MILGGNFQYLGNTCGNLASIKQDGAINASFPVLDGTVSVIAGNETSGWYLGGDFQSCSGEYSYLIRLEPDGTLDDSFQPQLNGPVSALYFKEVDSTLIAAGTFTSVNSQPRAGLVSFTADDSVSSWSLSVNGSVHSIVEASGFIYLGGSFSLVEGATRNNLARFAPETGLLDSWNPGANAPVYDMAVSPDQSQIFIGGQFFTVGGETRSYLASFGTGDGFITSWDPSPDAVVYSVAISPDGSQLSFAGGFTTVGVSSRSGLAQVSVSDGQVTTFVASVNSGAVKQVRYSSDGQSLWIAGDYRFSVGTSPQIDSGLMLLNSSSGDPEPWNTSSIAGSVSTVLPYSGGVIAGGDFLTSPYARNNLASFDKTTGAVTNWNPAIQSTVTTVIAAINRGSLYVGGDFTQVDGQTRYHVAEYSLSDFSLTLWAPPTNDASVKTMLISTDEQTLYIAGSMTSAGGNARGGGFALDTDNANLLPWNPLCNDVIESMAFSPDYSFIYLGGMFSMAGGLIRNHLAKIAASDGVADAAWNPDVNGYVYSLVNHPDSDSLVIGGSFSQVGGSGVNNLARVRYSDGGLEAWNAQPDNTVRELILSESGLHVLLAGDFSTVEGVPASKMAAVRATDAVVISGVTTADGSVSMLLASDKWLFSGGDFSTVEGIRSPAFAGIYFLPEVITSLPEGDYNTTVTIELECRAFLPCSKIYYNYYNENSGTPPTTASAIYTTPVEFTLEGEYFIGVLGEGDEGYLGSSKFFSYNVDRTPPVAPSVSGITPTNDPYPDWTWTVSGGGNSHFRVKMDDSDLSLDSEETMFFSWSPATPVTHGDHILYVQERDNAGNWSGTGSFMIHVDLTPPGSPVVTSPIEILDEEPITNDTTPQWTWTPSGIEDGVGAYRYALNDSGMATPVLTTATDFIPDSPLAEGAHTLYVQERDALENWSIPGFYRIWVDLTAPATPSVNGTAITSDPQPVWSWSTGGNGNDLWRYKLDDINMNFGATETELTTYMPASPLTDGSHTVYVQERDYAGNWSPTNSYTTIVDTTPPGPPVVSAPTPTNMASWSWISAGAGSGYFQYKLGDSDFSSGASEVQMTSSTSMAWLAEGTYTLYVREIDDIGNWSLPGSFTLIVDQTPPNSPSVTSQSALTSVLTPRWTWVSGGATGVYRYKLDENLFDGTEMQSTNTEWSPPSALDQGAHTLYVQEKDNAGNWSASGYFTVVLDVTPPFMPVIHAESPVNTRRPVWNWVSGGGGGASVFRYAFDFGSWQETTATTFIPSIDVSEGIHTLAVQERDLSMNWSPSRTSSVEVDLTPPQPPSVTADTPVTAAVWNVGSLDSSTGEYRARVDVNDFTSGYMLLGPGAYENQSLSEGSHTLYVQEKDPAGNWSASASMELVLDKTPPGSPSVSGMSLTSDSTPFWQWSSGGGGNGTYQYAVDTDINSGRTTLQTLISSLEVLEDGAHVFRVRERDDAGNWSPITEFVTVVDTIPPDSPSVSSEGLTSNALPLWTWTPDSDFGGRFRYQLNSENFSSASPETTAFQWQPLQPLSEGEHILYVEQIDAAGHWSLPGYAAVTVDTISPVAPSLSGPELTNSAYPMYTWSSSEPGGDYVLSFSSFPTLITTAGDTWKPAAPLGEGQYVFQLQHRDFAGNLSPAVSLTTVLDFTPPSTPLNNSPVSTDSSLPEWRWLSQEGNSNFRVLLDSNDFAAREPVMLTTSYYQAPIALTPGNHVLYVQERDAAGNWSPTATYPQYIQYRPRRGWTLAGGLSATSVSDFKLSNSSMDSIWTYESGQWLSSPALSMETLIDILPSSGYWIKLNDDSSTLSFLTTADQGEHSFEPGWNLVGGLSGTVESFLVRHPEIKIIVTEDDEKWVMAGPDSDSGTFAYYSKFTSFQPHKGYFIRSDHSKGSFYTLGTGGIARAEHVGFVWGNRFYFHGGISSGGALNDIDIFNPESGTWGIPVVAGQAQYAHAGVLFEDKFYLMGGRDSSSRVQALFQVFDPATNAFSILPDAPFGIYHHQGFVLDRKLYFVGGKKSDGIWNQEVLVWDLDAQNWSVRSGGVEREDSVILKDSSGAIVLYGGSSSSSDGFAYEWDNGFVKADWSGSPRSGLSGGTAGSCYYFSGGRNSELALLSNLEAYCKDTGWSIIDGFSARSHHVTLSYNNRLYSWGGYGDGGIFLNELQAYVPAGSKTDNTNQPPFIPSLTVLGDQGNISVTFDILDPEGDIPLQIQTIQYRTSSQREYEVTSNFQGSTSNLVPSHERTFVWNSARDVNVNTSEAQLRIQAADNLSSAYYESMPFMLLNNAVPAVLSFSLEGKSGVLRFHSRVREMDQDVVSSQLEYSFDGNLWESVSGLQLLTWIHETDIVQARDYEWNSASQILINTDSLQMRYTVDDGRGERASFILTGITLFNGENHKPVVSDLSVFGEQGDIPVVFQVEDLDQDSMQLSLYYRSGVSWVPAAFSGLNTNSIVSGSGHQFIWNSRGHIKTDEETRVRVCADDGRPGGESCLESERFLVRNGNTGPVISEFKVSGNRGILELSFSLNDPERQRCTIFGEYSLDGGLIWQNIPVDALLGYRFALANGENRILYWDTSGNVSGYESSVVVRIRSNDGVDFGSYAYSSPTWVNNGSQWDSSRVEYSGVPREGHVMAMVGNKAYYWGGSIAENGIPVNGILMEDPAAGTFASLGHDGSRARRGHAGVAWGNNIYYFGGRDNYDNRLRTPEIYDVLQGRFTIGPVGGMARSFHEVVAWNGNVYSWGGLAQNEQGVDMAQQTMDIFSVQNQTWSTGPAGGIPRSLFSMVIYEDKIYCVGGRDSSGQPLNSVSIFDLSAGKWLPTINSTGFTPRYNHTATVVGEHLFVWGGRDANGTVISTMDIYDFKSNLWEAVSFPTSLDFTPRYSHTAYYEDGQLHFYGGVNSEGEVLSSIDVYTVPSFFKGSGSAASVTNLSVTGVSGHIRIVYTDKDSDGDACYPVLEYSKDNGESWLSIAPDHLTGEVDDFSGSEKTLLWNSVLDIPTSAASVLLRMAALDGSLNAPSYVISKSFSVDNNVNQKPVLTTTYEGNRGRIKVNYELYDPDGDLQELSFSYRQLGESSWSLSENLDSSLRSLSPGSGSFLWYSSLDWEQDGILELKLESCDGRFGGCSSDITTMTVLNSTSIPMAKNFTIAGSSDVIRGEYDLTGANVQFHNLSLEYSLDNGDSWSPVSEFTRTASLGGALNSTGVLWNSWLDVTSHTEGVRLRITPFDGGVPGIPAISAPFTVENGGAWNRYSGARRLRSAHSSIFYNGALYFWGGTGSSANHLNSMDVYNLLDGSWSTGISGGTPRSQHTGSLYRGKMYITGGMGAAGLLSSVDILDMDSGQWSSGTEMPKARRMHTATLYDGELYIWGGYTIDGASNQMMILNLDTMVWRTGNSGGISRYGHKALLHNKKIYFFGGYDGASYLNSVDIYDIESGTYSLGTARGIKRAFFSASAVDNRIYIWGGRGETGFTSTMEMLEFDSDVVVKLTSDGTPRARHSADYYDGKIYVWGGEGTSGLVSSMDVFVPSVTEDSSTSESSFVLVATAPLALSSLEGMPFETSVYLFGGEKSDGSYDSDMMVFHPEDQSLESFTPAGITGRSQYSVVNYRDSLYFWGGETALGVTNELLKFNPSANSFVSLGNGGHGRKGHAVALQNGKMMVWGGIDEYDLILNSLETYDFSQQRWSFSGTGGTARCFHSGLNYEGKIYFAGGLGFGGVALSSVDIFDPDTGLWETGVSAPRPRSHHKALLIHGKMYLIGGRDMNGNPLKSCDIFDFSTGKWSTDPNGGMELASMAVWQYADSVCQFGGIDGAYNTSDSVYCRTVEQKSGSSWSEPLSGGTARFGHSGLVYQDRAFFYGGTGVQNELNTIDIYDFHSKEFSAGASGGTSRTGHVGISHEGKFYYWGGSNAGNVLNSMDVYEPEVWFSGIELPHELYAHCTFISGNTVYLWGGAGSMESATKKLSGFSEFVERYDLGSGTWMAPLSLNSIQRAEAGCTQDESGNFYIYGGQHAFGISSALEVWDPVSAQKSSYTTELLEITHRLRHSVSYYDGKLWFIGGEGVVGESQQVLSSINSFDIKKETWRNEGDSLDARAGHTATVFDGHIYIWGGYDSSKIPVNSLLIFNPDTGVFREGPSGGTPRYRHSAIEISGKIYFFGGYDSNGEILKTIDIYDIYKNSWESGTAAPYGLALSSAVYSDNKFLWFGGDRTSDAPNRMLFYSILRQENTELTPKSITLDLKDHALAQDSGQAWIYGGAPVGTTNCLNQLYAYSPVSDELINKGIGLKRRCNHAGAGLDHKLYFWGGKDHLSSWISQMDIYSTTSAQWESKSFPAPELKMAKAVTYENRVYIWGGDTGNRLFIYDIPSQSWYEGSSGGTARKNHTAVLYNGKIYYWGGNALSNSALLNTMDIYDIKKNEWSSGLSGGIARANHTAVVAGNVMFIWGGEAGSDLLRNIDIYNFTANSGNGLWEVGISGGTPRKDHSAILYNTLIYYWGGINTSKIAVNQMDIYDTVNSSWIVGTSGGRARSGHSGFAQGDKLYFWGGRDINGDVLSTVDVYNTSTQAWSVSRSVGGVARAEHCGVNVDGKLFFFGGKDRWDQVSKQIDIYEIDNNSWDSGDDTEHVRTLHTATLASGNIYFWGGQGQAGTQNFMDIYAISSGRWLPGQQGGTARHSHAAVHQGDYLYFTGGRDASGNLINSVDVYKISSDTWSTLPAFGIKRERHQSAVENGYLFNFGGLGASGVVTCIDILNLDTLAADSQCPGEFGGVAGPRAMQISGEYILLGGESALGAATQSALLKLSHGVRSQWTRGMRGGIARTLHAGTPLYGRFYYYGGVGGNGSVLNTLDIYDPDLDSWTTSSSTASFRYGHGAAVWNGKIWFLGGRGPSGSFLETADVYDPESDSFTTVAIPWSMREGAGYVSFRKRLVSLSGLGLDGMKNTVEFYDPEHLSSSQGQPGGIARMQASSFEKDGKAWIYGGRDSVSTPKSVLQYFDLSVKTNQPPVLANLSVTGNSGNLVISCSVLDNDEEPVSIQIEYSVSDSEQYYPVPASHVDGNLKDLSSGTVSFIWKSYLDLFGNNSLVRIRVIPSDGQNMGQPLYSGNFSVVNEGIWSLSDTYSSAYFRQQYTAVENLGRVFIWGGIYRDKVNNVDSVRDTMFAYNPQTNAWENHRTGGRARYAHAGVKVDGKWYLYGGYSSQEGVLNTLDICTLPFIRTDNGSITLPEWTEGTAGGTARHSHVGFAWGGKLYFHGGRGNLNSDVYNSIDVYDIGSSQWQSGTTSGGTARFGHTGTFYNDKVYFFGGKDATESVLNSMDIFDLQHSQWYRASAAPEGRAFHQAVLVEDQIYFFGGETGGGTLSKAVMVYDISSDTWIESAATSLVTRKYHGAVKIDDNIYLWGGFTQDTETNVPEKMEIYNYK